MGNTDTMTGVSSRPAVPDAIRNGRVIAIGRRLDPATVPSIASALLESGVRAFEVTMDSDGALDAIAVLSARFAAGEFVVGAGTVLSVSQAAAAVEAGARFIVMPHGDLEIVRWAVERGIPCLPGALTPSEILAVWRAGAAAVKVFPASTAGPSFVREMRGPLPEIPLVPTGGISLENAPAFLQSGAMAVGMGSWLTGTGDTATIRQRASALVAVIGQSR